MTPQVSGGARRRPAPRGMVTVELAIGTLTATVLTAVLVTLTMLGVAQASASEASAQLARQIARGDDAAIAAAEDRTPGEAEVAHRDGGVEVTVTTTSFVLGLGHIPIRASTWAAYEPGEGP
ncbi:MAG: DUF4244 domain-containing protein [Propionibacterium sp.]|nr:DUF4244 domain-containing protein [Propionibacterium sp.]